MILALDLGGTKLSGALFSSSGDRMAKKYTLLQGRQGHQVGELILQVIRGYLQEYPGKIQGLGLAVPGISRQNSGTVWAPNIPGWDDYPLLQIIKEAFPVLPVWMDSDRACSVLGEVWQGHAQGCRDAIFLAVGTGIGAGILCDGRVVRGHADIAGAIGWMAMDRPYNLKYQACGCYEYHASGDGIAKVALDLLASSSAPSSLRLRPTLTSHDVFLAFKNDDPIARETIRQAIEFWGMACANLVSLFNPEKIIFGGGVFGPALPLLPDIYAEASRWAQPVSIQQVSFIPSKLGHEANLFGAAYLSLKNSNANV